MKFEIEIGNSAVVLLCERVEAATEIGAKRIFGRKAREALDRLGKEDRGCQIASFACLYRVDPSCDLRAAIPMTRKER